MIYTSKPSITSQETEDKLPGVNELGAQLREGGREGGSERERERVTDSERKEGRKEGRKKGRTEGRKNIIKVRNKKGKIYVNEKRKKQK